MFLSPLVTPDPREEEEHGHVPHVHADGEPEGHQVPAGDGGRQHLHVPPSDRITLGTISSIASSLYYSTLLFIVAYGVDTAL